MDKFTGDGIMAVFGAPVALEDHAVRACLAALGVQEETKRLAVDVHARDGVDLRLRVGLNSGQVIAGEIGSGPFGYTAVGEQVGMAQRMESVAPGSASFERMFETLRTIDRRSPNPPTSLARGTYLCSSVGDSLSRRRAGELRPVGVEVALAACLSPGAPRLATAAAHTRGRRTSPLPTTRHCRSIAHHTRTRPFVGIIKSLGPTAVRI